MQKQKYTYDGKFEGNILVVGKTGRGKTCFAQRIAVNNLFDELKKMEWVSQIELPAWRAAEIQSCFAAPDEFHNPSRVKEADGLLVHFNKINSRSFWGRQYIWRKRKKMDRLIVMD